MRDVILVVIFFLVSPETEDKIYTDDFFRSKDIIVNALDNVEARRYVDRYVLYMPNVSTHWSSILILDQGPSLETLKLPPKAPAPPLVSYRLMVYCIPSLSCSRCVTNEVALLESGTMGPKGHIQVGNSFRFLITRGIFPNHCTTEQSEALGILRQSLATNNWKLFDC